MIEKLDNNKDYGSLVGGGKGLNIGFRFIWKVEDSTESFRHHLMETLLR